jgi:NAD+ synthase (glutamine-hydrolysing)
MNELVIALAQVNTTVGDLEGNVSKILQFTERAADARADIVAFPELCLTGYPPEDLLLKEDFTANSMSAARELSRSVGDIIAVVGFVEKDSDTFNSAAVMNRGEIIGTYRKARLPNYGVFDEQRYFGEGREVVVVHTGGVRVGLTICEDIWLGGGPVEAEVAGGGAEIILNLSASPFNRGKYDVRMKLIETRSIESSVVLAYANAVGAQDELVFDGGSCVYHPQEGFIAVAPQFREALVLCKVRLGSLKGSRMMEPRFRYIGTECPNEINTIKIERPKANTDGLPDIPRGESSDRLQYAEEIFEALILGLQDYVKKNGFQKVIIGLSGGIDSALTAAVAVKALGKENVICAFLPSSYTSAESESAAEEMARNLGVRLLRIPIGEVYDAYRGVLAGELGEDEVGETFENIQARIRGNLLMALSNRFGWLVLATGNKSELSVGYCTLYGDMAGGFALIKDLLKTQVYQLAEFINEKAGVEVIPKKIIDRPPTAELRHGQLDTDSLPPYEEMDPVLEAYIEEGLSGEEIIGRGFRSEMVRWVISKVDANEYKRRQAPVGVKITPRAFGRDWRMPISKTSWQ